MTGLFGRSMTAGAVRRRVSLFAAALLVLSSAMTAHGQSVDVDDRSNAVRIGVYGDIERNVGLRGYGGQTALSIAGVMDVGTFFSSRFERVAGVDGVNRSIGFVYNIMPIKQQFGIPLSAQLSLAYGVTFVDPLLVVATLSAPLADDQPFEKVENVDSTRRQFVLGSEVSRTFHLGRPIAVRAGFGAEYQVARTAYSATFTAGEETTTETRGEREMSATVGPSVSLRFQLTDATAVTAGSRFRFSDSGEFTVRPELGVVLFHQ